MLTLPFIQEKGGGVWTIHSSLSLKRWPKKFFGIMECYRENASEPIIKRLHGIWVIKTFQKFIAAI